MVRRWSDLLRRLIAERESIPPEMRHLGANGLDCLIDREIARLKAELELEEAPEIGGRRASDHVAAPAGK